MSDFNNLTQTQSSDHTYVSALQLQTWCDEYLQAAAFKDYCPNGLQVDGDKPISRLVTGVTASQALIDRAIENEAQAILVHHGYFWKGEPAPLVGIKGKRIRTLMQHGVSLLAYHLPLDAHPVVGNNAQLATLLDIELTGGLYPNEAYPIGNLGWLKDPVTPEDFANRIAEALHREPLHIASGRKTIQKIALCTGAAQDMIEQAVIMQCDAFISGEVSERTTHLAKEWQIDYFACGHHATERGGVLALGKVIEQTFGIEVVFIDVDNPV